MVTERGVPNALRSMRQLCSAQGAQRSLTMTDCPNDPSNGYGDHNATHSLPCSVPGCDCAAALRKDAERCRWLRQDETAADWWNAGIVELYYGDYSRKTGESLDVAVDAAMKGRAVGDA
jgi:hypothetical protein